MQVEVNNPLNPHFLIIVKYAHIYYLQVPKVSGEVQTRASGLPSTTSADLRRKTTLTSAA